MGSTAPARLAAIQLDTNATATSSDGAAMKLAASLATMPGTIAGNARAAPAESAAPTARPPAQAAPLLPQQLLYHG
jgi:hypothetical protein